MLSKRAEVYLGEPEFLLNCLNTCAKDGYSSSNPTGYINLGTAVNCLCEDLISERFLRGDLWSHEPAWQHYTGLNGTEDLLRTAAGFLQERLAQGQPVSPEHLRMVNGVSAGLEVLSWVLADPEDLIIVPTPTYSRFFADMNERMQTQVVGLPLGEGFALTPTLLETEILRRREEGGRVRGYIHCNPNNPLGVVYPRNLIMQLMEVCAKYKVHFISDEIYALTLYDRRAAFSSVLSIPVAELPDPDRTHQLWGLSKDFGLAGFRLGFIHTYNNNLIRCLDGMNFYTCASVHIQQVAAKLLGDKHWLDETYFPTNRSRLEEAYGAVMRRMTKLSIPVFEGQAGLFIWADFRRFLTSQDQLGEMELFQRLWDEAKVYLVPGTMFDCAVPGWIRIVFSTSPDSLEEGMDRLEVLLGAEQPGTDTGTLEERKLSRQSSWAVQDRIESFANLSTKGA